MEGILPSGDGSWCIGMDLEQNKRTVQAFYDLTFNRSRPAEAVEPHVGKTYVPNSSPSTSIATA